MSLRILRTFAVCLVATVSALHAQRLFVSPGVAANGQNIQVLATSPLTSITGFQSGIGTYQVLGLPDGSKFYAIGSTANQSITAVDSAFQVPRNIAALAQPPTAAALSPDGSILAVAAGNLHLFNTASDTEIVPNGINVGFPISVIDVAFSLDGKILYTLGVGANTTQINEIDPATHLIIGNMGFHGTATSITVGPNGLVYVTLTNELIDINPTTFAQNPHGPIIINAQPGRPVFTPDGLYVLVANQTPITGSALLLISLANRAVVSSVPSLQIGLDSLYVTGTNTILGYASSTQSAYQITINSAGTLAVSTYALPGSNSIATAFAVSNEVPIGGRTYVDSVYAVVNGTVEQLDPPTGHLKSQSGLPTGMSGGALSFTRPAVTGTLPVTILSYGGGQMVAPGAVSAPLVARVLNTAGLPISGATISFATNDATSTVSPTSATTGSNGYAVTYLTGGAINSQLKVTATTGTHTAVFNMAVGNIVGPSAGGLTFVSGQGQIIVAGNNTDSGQSGEHLSVLVTDTDGNPLANTPVTFLITNGEGTLFLAAGVGGGAGAQTQVANSGTNGIATVDFLAGGVNGGDATRGFAQTQVTVSAPNTNNLTYTITIVPGNATATIQVVKPQAGDIISGQVNQIIPGALLYQIVSATGYGIPGVGVNLRTQNVQTGLSPTATCNDPSGNGVLSDGTGRITCDLVLGSRVGKANIIANVGYFVDMPTFQLVVTPGPAATVKPLQGNNQSGLAGVKLNTTLLVQVSDAGGNLLIGSPVTWSVIPTGAALLSQVIAKTDSNGRASAQVTLGDIAGPFQIVATSGNAATTFNLAVIVPSSGIQKVSGDGQSAVINTPFTAPLIAEVTGSDGLGVAGAIVNFQVASGTATLGASTVTSDTNGQVSTTVQAGATAGPITVTATTATFSVTFTLTARLPGPTNLSIINGASFQTGTGISPGGIAIVTGTGLLPGVEGLVMANNIVGPLPTSLQGTSITFGGVPAPIYYVMNSQGVEEVAVQVPFETLPLGATAPANVSVVVTASSGTPATISVPIKPFAPGIFSTTSGTQTLAVAQRPDGSYVSATNPAQLGENITVYVTGLGEVTPAAATGTGGIPGQAVITPMLIGLNNSGVPLISANYVEGLVGVYAVTFHVPATTATGAAQPLAVIAYDSAGHFYFSQGISIPVQ
jgi:uncharacterized protein (TIGR03437 family)